MNGCAGQGTAGVKLTALGIPPVSQETGNPSSKPRLCMENRWGEEGTRDTGMSPSWHHSSAGGSGASPQARDGPPTKRKGGAHLVGRQQRLAEGFSPVDGEPGTGHLHPPGRETRGNRWGQAFWEEQAAMKPRRVPLRRKRSGHIDSTTDVTGESGAWRGMGMGHPVDTRAGGQHHSRVHVGEELQLAGEDLREQHPHEGPAQGAETRLQVLQGKRHPRGSGEHRLMPLASPPKPACNSFLAIRPLVGALWQCPLGRGSDRDRGLWPQLTCSSPQRMPQPNEVITAQ